MRALVGLTTGVNTQKTELSLTTWGHARRLVLDENYTGFLQNPVEGDRHEQTQDAGSLGLRGRWGYQVHPRVQLQIHGNWQGDVIDQRQDELLATGQPWATTRDLRIHQNTWGIGPGVRAQATDWLTIEGGLRLDVFHDAVQDRLQNNEIFRETFWAVSPRVAMRAQLGRRWQLFTAYGRGFRSPDARAITLPRGPQENVDLDVYAGGEPRMTLTDAVEVGTRFTPNRLFDAGATAFGTFIARESIFDHVSGFNIELSGTRRLGGELDVQIHPTPWMDLGADVTAVYGRFVSTDAPIPGAPPLLVSTFGSLAHPTGWHAGWRWFLLGPRPLSYGARAGVVTVLDASVGYRARHFGIDLFLDNVLGLKWREGEYNFASHWDLERPRSQLPTVHYIAGYPRMIRAAITVWF
jgi:outer membrane receptor protein involved in Fe transport